MSATADDSGEAHRYFRAIEETFIRLRGAPLLLSPADWRVAREWHREGIPLEVVSRALEAVFARLAAADPDRRISSLRYCAPAVREAWSVIRELSVARPAGGAPRLDPAPRLRALARSLPAGLPDRARLVGEIEGLTGAVEKIEARLRALDADLLELARVDLSRAAEASIEEEVTRGLESVRRRLPVSEIEALRERLERQALRRESGLPWLSLFSPDASDADTDRPA